MTKGGKWLKGRNEFFNKADFVGVAGLHGGKSDKKNSNMGDSANIGNGIKAFNGRFLHRERKQTGKDSFGRSTVRINFLKKLRAAVNGFPDRVVDIEPDISRAAEAVREEFRMVPRAEGMFSGEFFGSLNRADKFMTFSIMRFVKKGASGNHIETGETNRDAFRGKRERRDRSGVSRVAGDDRRRVKFVGDKVEDPRGVVSGIGDNSAGFQIEGGSNKFKLGDEKLRIMDIGGFRNFVDGEFGQGVVENMVTVSPEVRNGFF
jgi:hypothetical protein